jgi:hypothetical protein
MQLYPLPEPVETELFRRGFVIARVGRQARQSQVLSDPTDVGMGVPEPSLEAALESRAFRALVQRLMRAPRGAVAHDEIDRIAGRKAADYLKLLERIHAVSLSADGITYLLPIDNLGPTFESHVARVCRDELGAASAWGVELEDMPIGGDYDVLAWLPPALLYIETKTSRQTEINESELRHFLQRSADLAPEIAVLLVDTRDDLQPLVDRLNDIMGPAISGADGGTAPQPPVMNPQQGGFYFGYGRYYVVNTEPAIARNLRRCIRYYHTRVKGIPSWGALHEVRFTGPA